MRTRRIGATPPLTEIGFGAAQLGNLNREITDEVATETVEAAWDAGIRYFDTAPHYGRGLSEQRLGAALAAHPRDEYVVSTKAGRLLVPDPSGLDHDDDQGFVMRSPLRRVWDFSRDGILRSVHDSLERLGMDRLDIVYLHDPDDHWEAASTTGIDTLIELRDQGVIGAIGAGMNQADMLTEFIRRCDVDVVMVAGRYTLVDQSAAETLLPAASERGVAVVAAAVYNSGLLSSDRPTAGARFDYREASPDLVARAAEIADIADDLGATLPAAAIAFPLRTPQVASVVVGMRGRDQVTSTRQRYDARPPEQLWARLGLD